MKSRPKPEETLIVNLIPVKRAQKQNPMIRLIPVHRGEFLMLTCRTILSVDDHCAQSKTRHETHQQQS